MNPPMRKLLLFLAVCASAHAAERKPNILLIYSDDHGWADLGAQGANAEVRTPNLDQLARDGVRFARGYVTAPQCVPSRAGVITGRYQQRRHTEGEAVAPQGARHPETLQDSLELTKKIVQSKSTASAAAQPLQEETRSGGGVQKRAGRKTRGT